MSAQGRMLEFKHLFPWVYAQWIWLGRFGLRLQWLLVKPIRVRVADIWTVSAVAAACGVLLAILLFVFRGAQAVEAQQPLDLSAGASDAGEELESPGDPAPDVFIPAALAAYQPNPDVPSSIPAWSAPQSSIPASSIPLAPTPSSTSPGISIRHGGDLQATMTRTLLPAGWDQRESMELVSVPDPYVELRPFDPRDPWRLATMLPASNSPPFDSYVGRVGRLDSAELGPPLVTSSEMIDVFDDVSSSEERLIAVTKHVPEQVRRGESFAYEIEIVNLTPELLESVLVQEHISALDRVEAVEPAAKVVGDYLWWDLMLEPFETRLITIELRPSDVGSVSSTAEVTVISRIGSITEVSEPSEIASGNPPVDRDVEPSVAQQPAPIDPFPPSQPLIPRSSIPMPPAYQPQPVVSMTIDDSAAATVGREWSTVFTVTNTGDAAARYVAIRIALPPHFYHRHGASIEHEIDELLPGTSRTATLIVRAETAGRPQFDAKLSVEEVVVQEETVEVSVSPANTVEQASHQVRESPRPQPCPTEVYLVRPGCGW